MCLIAFAWRAHSRWPLIVAANRDEFRDRPAAPLARWPGGEIVAGRDLAAGGTWLGLTRSGRFAAVTNVRDPLARRSGARSRGELVVSWLSGATGAADFARHLGARFDHYADFNLLFGDRAELWYAASLTRSCRPLAPGIYALSNHLLDSPWPKVQRARAALEAALSQLDPGAALAQMLDDGALAAPAQLPDTGVEHAWEHALSAIRIDTPSYGTRVSTVLLAGADSSRISERSRDPGGGVVTLNG